MLVALTEAGFCGKIGHRSPQGAGDTLNQHALPYMRRRMHICGVECSVCMAVHRMHAYRPGGRDLGDWTGADSNSMTAQGASAAATLS